MKSERPRNIETSYGKFQTLTHYEYYWKRRIADAFNNGFNQGMKYEQELHRR